MPAKKKPKALTLKLFIVRGCTSCHNGQRTERTRGAGFAHDRFCDGVKPPKEVAGYVEWPSEERSDGDFPDWCPLADALENDDAKA